MSNKHPVSAITALPPSPEQDRHNRMVKYVLAMSLRVFCILMCFFVQGWWLLVFAIGAIVLPYLAVVLANVGGETGGQVLRPGGLEPLARQRPIIPDDVPSGGATREDAADGAENR